MTVLYILVQLIWYSREGNLYNFIGLKHVTIVDGEVSKNNFNFN